LRSGLLALLLAGKQVGGRPQLCKAFLDDCKEFLQAFARGPADFDRLRRRDLAEFGVGSLGGFEQGFLQLIYTLAGTIEIGSGLARRLAS
jgi:hypothetical protein